MPPLIGKIIFWMLIHHFSNFDKFSLKIGGEIIFQSWLLLTPFFNLTIVQWSIQRSSSWATNYTWNTLCVWTMSEKWYEVGNLRSSITRVGLFGRHSVKKIFADFSAPSIKSYWLPRNNMIWICIEGHPLWIEIGRICVLASALRVLWATQEKHFSSQVFSQASLQMLNVDIILIAFSPCQFETNRLADHLPFNSISFCKGIPCLQFDFMPSTVGGNHLSRTQTSSKLRKF